MRKVIVAMLTAALVAAVAFPSAASASVTLSRFKVADWGSRIHYFVTVCGSSGRITFTSYLHSERGIAPTYQGTYRVFHRGGCRRWDLSEHDGYGEGIWDAQVRAVLNGRAQWTPLRYVDIT